MEVNTQGNGSREISQVRALTDGLMEQFIMVNGSRIRCKGRVSSHRKMEVFMLEQ